MNKRILLHALAMGLCAIVVGCAPGLIARSAAFNPIGTAAQPSGPYIDLRGGMTRVPSGYGLVTVHLTGLPQATGYSAQSLGSGAKTVVIRVRSSSNWSDVVDVTGNPAIYKANVTGTSATIAFPALPSTSTNPGDLDTTNGSPYIFQMRCYTASKSFPTAVFSPTGATLSAWVNPTDVSESISDPTLLASGESRQNVVAGLPTTVSILSWAHVAANLNTSGSPAVSQVTLTAVPADTTKTVRIRLTGAAYTGLGDPTKTPAFATGGFTIGGTPQLGDYLSLSWTDIDGDSNAATYSVQSGDTTATIASALATALNTSTPGGSNYTAATSGGAVTITSKLKNGIWDAAPSGPLAVTVAGPKDAISVISMVISGGTSTTNGTATLPFSLANGYAAPEPGDAILFNFQDQESTPHAVSDIYTVTSSDTTLANLALDISNYLNAQADFNADYTASNSATSVIITAKSTGPQFDSTQAIPNSIVPPSPTDTVSGITNILLGEPLTVIRAALNYSAANTLPASWSVSTAGLPGTGPGDSTHLGLKATATTSVLIGGVTWQGSTLLLHGTGQPAADTVQYIDIPVVSSSTDGLWDIQIFTPGAYATFQAFDLETGRSLTTSVPVQ